MKLIAHRGNIFGENSAEENKPEYIDLALKMGYDAEIDLRYKDHMFYLGHDEPQYHVPMTWLVKWKDKLWIHCKDLESLDKISSSPVDFNYFWHQKDDFTLTSQKYIWTYPNNVSVIGQNDTSSITINWAGTTGGKICASIQTICGISPPLCDTVDIVPIPVAALPLVPRICVDSLTSITATGNTLPGYQYNWNFDGGNLVTNPPLGPGPHQISWGDPGIKDVELTIGVQACTSNLASTQVEVVAPLVAVVLV